MRGNQGVKEHTDHKPRNALPGGLVDELARTQNYKRQSIYMFLYIIYSSIVYLYGYTPLSHNDTRYVRGPSVIWLKLLLFCLFLVFDKLCLSFFYVFKQTFKFECHIFIQHRKLS